MVDKTSFVRIGQLAKLAGIFPSKIRYYVQEGLLSPADRTRGGYYLFNESRSLDRLRFINELQQRERLSLTEIKERLDSQMER